MTAGHQGNVKIVILY